ncbi:unnamed protein product [marine sediment metagenome]|uniref:Uncharacterized protein n=1 Tax=marine sediment metagenome TaxID=412755 RepID=X1JB45_9ZZZZ
MLPTIFTITGEDITAIIGYIGEVFTDVSPLFFVIMGISLGLWILGSIIRAVAHRKED